ncbi:hypothetical protein [Burkholderia cenocepacia]|uniref:hypothetical protein n=1 Tax=Burkholderia cenocepacia TaxID=95486 RepID=UPI0019050DBD|nr:hypothetical protein [Burkholderia cenocepacia]
MIDDGLSSRLVPTTPWLEKQLRRHVFDVTRDGGGVYRGFRRNRAMGPQIEKRPWKADDSRFRVVSGPYQKTA